MEGSFPLIFRNYIDLNDEEHNAVLDARNHPEVRSWMFDKELITFDHHLNFIKHLKSSSDSAYFAAYKEKIYCGSIYLTGLSTGKAYYGYFSSPHLFGTKNGIELYYYGLSFLIQNYEFETVYGEIFKENKRALRIAGKFGFSAILESDSIIEISRPTATWPLNLTGEMLNRIISDKNRKL